MRLRYYLHLMGPLLRDFAKTSVILGVIFAFMFGGYLLLSLLFLNAWVTGLVFFGAVGWGTWLNFTERGLDPTAGPLSEYYASERAASVTHAERLAQNEAEEEEILGAC